MKRPVIRRSAAAAVTLAAVGLATLTAVGTASAATATTGHTTAGRALTGHTVRPLDYGEFTTNVLMDGVNIREGASTDTVIYGQANTGDVIEDYCSATGSDINGNTTWDWVQDLNNGVAGFISEYYLAGTQSQPC